MRDGRSLRSDDKGAEGEKKTPEEKGKGDDGEGGKKKEYRKKTCSDCNKQYCLSQGLRICEGKAAEEVFTTCFRRF